MAEFDYALGKILSNPGSGDALTDYQRRIVEYPSQPRLKEAVKNAGLVLDSLKPEELLGSFNDRVLAGKGEYKRELGYLTLTKETIDRIKDGERKSFEYTSMAAAAATLQWRLQEPGWSNYYNTLLILVCGYPVPWNQGLPSDEDLHKYRISAEHLKEFYDPATLTRKLEKDPPFGYARLADSKYPDWLVFGETPIDSFRERVGKRILDIAAAVIAP